MAVEPVHEHRMTRVIYDAGDDGERYGGEDKDIEAAGLKRPTPIRHLAGRYRLH